jgi:hypothetical protein
MLLLCLDLHSDVVVVSSRHGLHSLVGQRRRVPKCDNEKPIKSYHSWRADSYGRYWFSLKTKN